MLDPCHTIQQVHNKANCLLGRLRDDHPAPTQVSTNAMLFSLGAIPPRPAYGQPLRPMVRPMPPAPPGATTPVAPSPPGARPAPQQPQPMPSNVATAPAPAHRPPQPPATANNLVAPMQNMHIQQQQAGVQVKIIYTSILPQKY